MDQRVSLTTLAVDDVDAAAAFYERLGWTVKDRDDDIVVFELLGAALALYRRTSMARDMGLAVEDLGPGGTVLAANVRGAEDVQPVLDAVRAAGGEVLVDAHEVFWGGTTGYFRDPDGYLWEVAHNPHAPLAPDGRFRWDGYDEHGAELPPPTP